MKLIRLLIWRWRAGFPKMSDCSFKDQRAVFVPFSQIKPLLVLMSPAEGNVLYMVSCFSRCRVSVSCLVVNQ